MDDDAFWALMKAVDVEALRAGDEDAAVEPLQEKVAQLAPADIERFAEHLAQKLYALDGKRWADAAGESGGSDDAFLYARAFVVASGRARYEAVRADPLQMPTSIDEWCEALLYVPSEAFEQAGRCDWQFQTSVSYESGSNRAHWD